MLRANKNFCLVGLPDSGKSTFVAALWHIVEAKELNESLQISTLPQNRVYLEKIRENWLECSDINRTIVENVNHINLDVKDNTSKNTAQFAFPDVKGEVFKQLFETRELSKEYFGLLERADGILLFIGDKIKRPIMISEYEGAFEGMPPNPAEPWKHEFTPTQVVLVDLMQTISNCVIKPFKVAIIISAWDKHLEAAKVLDKKIKPEEWLKKTLPLLYQYISTNKDKIFFTCFGISAQGGDYKAGKEELFNIDLPSKRIKVQQQGNDEISHDISIPLKWLLDNE